MAFFFDEKRGEPLMARINLRDVNSRANLWDHPVKGLLKYAEEMKKCQGDVLKLSKKTREVYCLSIFGLALQHDSGLEWWTHITKLDAPDGLVMTLGEVEKGGYKGLLREVEIVEHRMNSDDLLSVIKRKMTEKSYEANTIIGCLILTTGLYDLEKISKELSEVSSTVNHVFVVFTGSMLSDKIAPETLAFTYTMVQLLPVFRKTTFDFRPFLEDYKERYEKGQESRIINGNEIHYGTSNLKYRR